MTSSIYCGRVKVVTVCMKNTGNIHWRADYNLAIPFFHHSLIEKHLYVILERKNASLSHYTQEEETVGLERQRSSYEYLQRTRAQLLVPILQLQF